MIEVISLIFSVATSTVSACFAIRGMKTEKRKKASEYLKYIAELLQESIDKYKTGEIPHGACESLRQLAIKYPEIMEELVGKEKAVEYMNDLVRAHEIETWLISIENNPEAIVELQKAATSFSIAAIAVTIEF